jgi:hypothetical protein
MTLFVWELLPASALVGPHRPLQHVWFLSRPSNTLVLSLHMVSRALNRQSVRSQVAHLSCVSCSAYA